MDMMFSSQPQKATSSSTEGHEACEAGDFNSPHTVSRTASRGIRTRVLRTEYIDPTSIHGENAPPLDWDTIRHQAAKPWLAEQVLEHSQA